MNLSYKEYGDSIINISKMFFIINESPSPFPLPYGERIKVRGFGLERIRNQLFEDNNF